MTRRGLGPAVAVLLALAGLVVVLSGGSGQAGPPALQVSLGASGPFADGLPHSLFRGTGLLVPGDRVERTFYVRNGSTTPALTTVQVGFDRENTLSDALDLRVGIDGAAETGEVDDSGNQTFAGKLALEPGEVQPVDVVMSFDRATRTQAMDERAQVEMLVTITEATGSRPGLDCREHVEVAGAPREGVTAATQPRCVPTAVASGQPGAVLGVPALPQDPFGLAALAGLAGLATLAGAYAAMRVSRRRREVAARG